jgi:flagellar biosynthesis protein FlhF
MAAAMALVRTELGDNAIIMSSKELPDGSVRVSAALDDSTSEISVSEPPIAGITRLDDLPDEEEIESQPPIKPVPNKTTKPSAAATRKKDKQLESSVGSTIGLLAGPEQEPFGQPLLDGLMATLLDHGTPQKLAHGIIEAGQAAGGSTPIRILTDGLAARFSFRTPAEIWSDKPLMLVGPHGSGKTLMLAKLTARSVLRGLKPVVITTDVVRAGAVDQLAAFTRIMDLPLLTADGPEELYEKIQDIGQNAQQILIDTGGLNPYSSEETELLGDLIQAARAEAVLVLPAGSDALESAIVATAFRTLGARHLIATRLDAARRYGSLLAAAYQGRLSFSYISQSTTVAAGIREASPALLADFLLTRGEPQRNKPPE